MIDKGRGLIEFVGEFKLTLLARNTNALQRHKRRAILKPVELQAKSLAEAFGQIHAVRILGTPERLGTFQNQVAIRDQLLRAVHVQRMPGEAFAVESQRSHLKCAVCAHGGTSKATLSGW